MSFKLLLYLLFSLLTVPSCLHGFEIINSSISPDKSFQIGSTATLNCRTDSEYKACKWWLGGHENKKYCNFEKKSNLNKIIPNECTLKDRIKVEETHDFNDCTIVLSNIQLSDSGRWTCRMKDRGFSEERMLHLKVLPSKENEGGIYFMNCFFSILLQYRNNLVTTYSVFCVTSL